MEPTRVCLLSCIIIRDKPERRYGPGPKLEMDCQLLLNLSSKLSHSWSLLGTQARPKCKLWIWDRFYMILLTSQSHFPTPAAHLRQEEFQPGDRVRPIENWLGTSTQLLNQLCQIFFPKAICFFEDPATLDPIIPEPESARPLPKCAHIFHASCLEQWILTQNSREVRADFAMDRSSQNPQHGSIATLKLRSEDPMRFWEVQLTITKTFNETSQMSIWHESYESCIHMYASNHECVPGLWLPPLISPVSTLERPRSAPCAAAQHWHGARTRPWAENGVIVYSHWRKWNMMGINSTPHDDYNVYYRM